MAHKISTVLFLKLRGCSPSVVVPLCSALEAFIEAAAKYKDESNKRKIEVVFRMRNQIVCDRLLKNRFGLSAIWDYGCGRHCRCLCLSFDFSLCNTLRITTPIAVRDYLGILVPNIQIYHHEIPLKGIDGVIVICANVFRRWTFRLTPVRRMAKKSL